MVDVGRNSRVGLTESLLLLFAEWIDALIGSVDRPSAVTKTSSNEYMVIDIRCIG